MICIVPDTNILLNTLKGNYDHNDFLSVLQTLVIENKVILVLTEQVKNEWDRNANEVLESAKQTLKQDISKAKRLNSFLLPSTRDEFISTMEKIDSEIDQMIEYRLNRKLVAINELINSYSISVPLTNENKVLAAEWALEKFPPFFGSRTNITSDNKDPKRKNSMGDALIFLSAIQYSTSNITNEVIFITENYQDFSAAGNKKIHSNLESLMPENLSYEVNMSKFYYKLTESTQYKIYTFEQSKIMEKRIEEENKRIEWEIEHPNYTLECPRCKSKLDDKINGFWRPSMYGGGLSWWRLCPECGLQWDTGDYYD